MAKVKENNTGISRMEVLYSTELARYYGLLVIGSVGIVTNCLVIGTMCKSRRLKGTSTGVIIICLAILDGALCLTGVCSNAVTPLSPIGLRMFIQYVIYVANCGSNFVTMLLCINWFALVCYPMSHQKVTNHDSCIKQLICVMVVSAITGCFVLTLLHDEQFDQGLAFLLWIMVMNVSFSRILPNIVIVILMAITLKTLRSKVVSRVISAPNNNLLTSQTDASPKITSHANEQPLTSSPPLKKSVRRLKSEKQMRRALLAVLIAFLVLRLPFNIIGIVYYTQVYHQKVQINTEIWFNIASLFHLANYVINLFLFGCYSDNFRVTFLDLICCRRATIDGTNQVSAACVTSETVH